MIVCKLKHLTLTETGNQCVDAELRKIVLGYTKHADYMFKQIIAADYKDAVLKFSKQILAKSDLLQFATFLSFNFTSTEIIDSEFAFEPFSNVPSELYEVELYANCKN